MLKLEIKDCYYTFFFKKCFSGMVLYATVYPKYNVKNYYTIKADEELAQVFMTYFYMRWK